MATSYKIRLRRFNGLDYDTLNLSSENIIRNNGNTVEQEFNNIIPSSNGMLKNNNGVFNVATLGTDYTNINDNLDSSTTQTYSINKIKSLGGALYLTNIPVLATTGDISTVNNSEITSNHVVAECVFANSSAIITDVTWSTSAGILILNGTCNSATTVNIVLVKTSN